MDGCEECRTSGFPKYWSAFLLVTLFLVLQALGEGCFVVGEGLDNAMPVGANALSKRPSIAQGLTGR